MEVIFHFDLDKIFQSKIGRFGLSYSDYLKSKRSKRKPKDNWERTAVIIFHLLGRASILYLRFFTYLYFRTLSEDEIEALRSGSPFD